MNWQIDMRYRLVDCSDSVFAPSFQVSYTGILARGSDFTGQRATVWHANHGLRATVITFLVPAYLGCPGKEAVQRVSVCLSSKRGIAIVVLSLCPSICLSVTFVHYVRAL